MRDKEAGMRQEHSSTILRNPFLCPEDCCKDLFSIRIGNTTYEVSTHFDPQGRQSVLNQFRRLLLTRNDNLT